MSIGRESLPALQTPAATQVSDERERANAILEGIGDAFYAVDRNWRIADMNSAAEAFLGVPRSSLIGRSLWDAFPELAGTEFEQHYRRAMIELAPQEFEAPSLVREGVKQNVRAFPLPDGIGVAFRDVTEQHRTAQARLESEERYRLATEAFEGGAWETDFLTGVATRSERMAELIGENPEDLVPTPEWWWQRIHPDDLQRFHDARDVLLGGRAERQEVEYRIRHREGHWVWLWQRAIAMRGPDGRVQKLVGAVIDISDRKRVERALRRSETRYRRLLEQSPLSIQTVTPEGRIKEVNRAWQMLFGVTLADVADYNVRSDPQLDDLGIRPYLDRAFAGDAVDMPIVPYVPDRGRFAGQVRWVRAVAYPITDGSRQVEEIVLVHEDVTERKAAEDALRESEAKFQTIADAIDQLVWSTRPDGYHDYFNRRWYEFTGLTAAESIGSGWNPTLHPDDRERAWTVWNRAVETGEPYTIEYRFRAADGRYRWFLGRALPMRDADGRIVRWFGTCTDIDDLKLAENRQTFLLGLNDRLRGAADPVAAVMVAAEALGARTGVGRAGYGDIDKAGQMVRVERDWTRDSTVASIAGEVRVLDAFGPAVIAELRAGRTLVVEDCLTDPRAGPTYAETWNSIGCRSLIVVPLIKERQLRAILYLHDPLPRKWTAAEIALAEEVAERTWEAVERARAQDELQELNANLERRITEEVAERAKAEEALRQAQKMEAVGQLTGGVAHDFNNLLMAILSSLELLTKRLPADDPQTTRLVENAVQGARRGAALTSRMLAFARKQDLSPRATDVPALVAGMSDLLKRSAGPGIRIETKVAEGVPKALVDPNQLELAILNLTVNARDAMPEGGVLRIEVETEPTTPEADHASYVVLSLTDTGSGMDEATLARATEPFFTTKEPGKGTGLGLSMVHGLAAQSGGRFHLRSEPGRGTAATIFLPVAPDMTSAGQRLSPAETPAATLGQRNLSVLLVDDDALVLMGTAGMLEDLGHRVVEALSGREALEVLRSGAAIDAVVTDHAMPGMTGVQLAQEIWKEWPEMPVVLATGFAEIPAELGQIAIERLGKPFRQEQLAESLARAVGSSSAYAEP